ncbi:MAG: hypothetical protein WCJ62_06145 [Flavobacterium sp.]
MIKKIFFSAFIVTTLFSCSSNTSSDNSGSTGTDVTVAMTTRIDGVIYDTPPQNGGNSADASGGEYGSGYFLLKGYKNVGAGKQVKIGNKIFNIKIVIPKSDVSVGTHNFNSTLVSGGYYADFDILGVSPAEAANTISGSINVTSYNSSTKLIKGGFNFTTNDGINLTNTSHTLIGSFSYVLQ